MDVKIQRALVSVSDKTGVVEFVQELVKMGVAIISTGGTARALKEAGIEVIAIDAVTGFPEMMDGRVKTLHPKIHGALLGLRDKAEHAAAMKEHAIEPIDLVCVNLYPFESVIKKKGVNLEEAIENIDIGGPSMLRSAAKNYTSVAVICNPARYEEVLRELELNSGILPDTVLFSLAVEVFGHTARYDSIIAEFEELTEG